MFNMVTEGFLIRLRLKNKSKTFKKAPETVYFLDLLVNQGLIQDFSGGVQTYGCHARLDLFFFQLKTAKIKYHVHNCRGTKVDLLKLHGWWWRHLLLVTEEVFYL